MARRGLRSERIRIPRRDTFGTLGDIFQMPPDTIYGLRMYQKYSAAGVPSHTTLWELTALPQTT